MPWECSLGRVGCAFLTAARSIYLAEITLIFHEITALTGNAQIADVPFS